jgi:SAM-dependent methyltransferase
MPDVPGPPRFEATGPYERGTSVDGPELADELGAERAARARLVEMINGPWVAQSLYVAAKLGLADMVDGATRSDDLAADLEVDAAALYRVMRGLASIGVFRETEPGTFTLAALGECLRTAAPGSVRAYATLTGELHFRCWAEVMHSVRTGRPAFELVFGTDLYAYLAARPDLAELFEHGVAERGRELHAAVVEALDLDGAGTIVDVGGGRGELLTALLEATPGARGILFDRPEVIAQAGPIERCEVVGGDFFEGVPAGGDVYVLSRVLHDWDDRRAASLLANCRRAMGDGGRLIVVSRVIPADDGPHESKLNDLNMLVMRGGRERTAAEFRTLLERAGFELAQVISTRSAVTVIEARPLESAA